MKKSGGAAKDQTAYRHGAVLAVKVLELWPHILQSGALGGFNRVHPLEGRAVLQQLVQNHGKRVDIHLDVVGFMPEDLQGVYYRSSSPDIVGICPIAIQCWLLLPDGSFLWCDHQESEKASVSAGKCILQLRQPEPDMLFV